MRAIKMLGEVGLDVTILKVPGAKAPDEYIKAYGADKFRELLNNTKSKFEYNADNILAKFDLNLPQDKIKALHEMEKLISETYSSAERDIYIRSTAQKFDVNPQSVKTDVDRLIAKSAAERKKGESEKIRQDMIGYSDRVNPDFIKAPAVAKNEETVLGLLLLFAEHRKYVFEGELLSEDDFFTELNRRIFAYLKKAYDDGDDSYLDMNEEFSEDEVGRITRMKISRMQLTDNGSDVIDASIAALRKSVSKKASQQTNTYEGLNEILARKRMN